MKNKKGFTLTEILLADHRGSACFFNYGGVAGIGRRPQPGAIAQ